MFRLSHYLRVSENPEAFGSRRQKGPKPGPVVIWNLTRTCNLKCSFCYAFAANGKFYGELNTQQAFEVVDDLAAMNLRMLILSGGEPLMRPDLFEIADYARSKGIRLTLSTNGCLITEENIGRIVATGFDYVGISLDGIGPVHDEIRGEPGSFDAALRGIRLCRDHGAKVGIRFTLTEKNRHLLDEMLDLVERERVNKFYLSHLNYAGRGGKDSGQDVVHDIARQTMERLLERCRIHQEKGIPVEVVTGNNDADGVWFLLWVQKNRPDKFRHMLRMLRRWGGNATGENIANIDNRGRVHPDSMWWSHTLGNVREKPFSKIWAHPGDEFMTGLRMRPRPLEGRCGECPALAICNGNTRTRAHKVKGNFWASDPGCYLSDQELNLFGNYQMEAEHGIVYC